MPCHKCKYRWGSQILRKPNNISGRHDNLTRSRPIRRYQQSVPSWNNSPRKSEKRRIVCHRPSRIHAIRSERIARCPNGQAQTTLNHQDKELKTNRLDNVNTTQTVCGEPIRNFGHAWRKLTYVGLAFGQNIHLQSPQETDLTGPQQRRIWPLLQHVKRSELEQTEIVKFLCINFIQPS